MVDFADSPLLLKDLVVVGVELVVLIHVVGNEEVGEHGVGVG